MGANGTGKTTLLRLLAGSVRPQRGTVTAPPTVARLPQDLVLRPDTRVDEHLGIAEVRATVAAIEGGATDQALFEVVGDDWDIDERTVAVRARLGLPADVLDRRLGELSGGECTSLALTALLLERPDVLLLDEPTNNLDRSARERLYDVVSGYRGTLVVVKLRKRAAQESAAKYRGVNEDRLEEARVRLDEAQDRLRVEDEIRVDLPGSAVPPGRRVLVLSDVVLRTGGTVDLELRGPERVALTGPNGSGKTTLLHTALGLLAPVSGTVDLWVPARLLPQRLDVLDPALTVAENAVAHAPGTDENTIRARLARFLFRGTAADRPARVLSGGELFRATLACLLLPEPSPQLLVLDEPTNNLDLSSVGQLVSALASYDGALLVASHDEAFLTDIGIERRIELEKQVRDASGPAHGVPGRR